MRQFKHKEGPFVPVFDGKKKCWFDTERNVIHSHTVLDKPSWFKTQDCYTELSPKDFVGLDVLEAAGYEVPEKKVEVPPMRQFTWNPNGECKDDYKKQIWVFQGTKENFVFQNGRLCEVMRARKDGVVYGEEIVELKPEEFVYLDLLQKAGYTIPVLLKLPEPKTYEDTGFAVAATSPQIQKMLMELARLTTRKLGPNSVSSANAHWFSFNGTKGQNWYGLYKRDLNPTNIPNITLDEAVATLVKCAVSQTKNFTYNGIKFNLDKNIQDIGITLGGTTYHLSKKAFDEVVKEVNEFMK